MDRHSLYRATTRATETGSATVTVTATADTRLEITTSLTVSLRLPITIIVINESCENASIVSSAIETESTTFRENASETTIDRSAIIEAIEVIVSVSIVSAVKEVIVSIVSVVREVSVRGVIVRSVLNGVEIVAERVDVKANEEVLETGETKSEILIVNPDQCRNTNAATVVGKTTKELTRAIDIRSIKRTRRKNGQSGRRKTAVMRQRMSQCRLDEINQNLPLDGGCKFPTLLTSLVCLCGFSLKKV